MTMRAKLCVWLAACGLMGAALPAFALQGRVVGTGFEAPLFVTAPKGDPRLFVVEKGGLVKVVSAGAVSTYLDVSDRVDNTGERGLLGLAFDPHFATNGRLYVSYVNAGGTHSVVDRYTVSPPSAASVDTATRQEIIAFAQDEFTNHKAGWIGFRRGDRGNLYMAVGDGGAGYDPNDNAQNGQRLLGKLLRINVAGRKPGYRIPADNPFVGSLEVRPEVWALGLRNPFRISFDRKTGDFWIADVGQDLREEVNFEPAGDPGGHNYGWRLREGSAQTPGDVGGDKPGLTAPAFEYPHVGEESFGTCITGGYVYRGPSIPEADGRYFFGDCISNRVVSYLPDAQGRAADLRDDTEQMLAGTGLFILASFGEDGRGRLYAVGFNGVVVAMCPGAPASRRERVVPNASGERRWLVAGGNPCANQVP